MITNNPYLSIVVPVYNEEDNISILYKMLKSECKTINKPYEIIFVDDGSNDKSISLLTDLYFEDKTVKIIKLSRNHGHQLALTAGLDNSNADFTITMDADLQHPPNLIHRFLQEAENGFEIVTGVKKETKQRGLTKKFMANLFYYLFKKISQVSVEPNASDFRLYSRKSLTVFKNVRERERYLRGIAEWIGFTHKKIFYVAPPRYAGTAKYTYKKLAQLASYGLFSFSAFPLRMSMFFGIGILLLCLCFIVAFFFFRHSQTTLFSNTNILFILLFFILGFLFFFVGVLGEYVLRIYEEVKGRPLYVVDWKKGFED